MHAYLQESGEISSNSSYEGSLNKWVKSHAVLIQMLLPGTQQTMLHGHTSASAWYTADNASWTYIQKPLSVTREDGSQRMLTLI